MVKNFEVRLKNKSTIQPQSMTCTRDYGIGQFEGPQALPLIQSYFLCLNPAPKHHGLTFLRPAQPQGTELKQSL